MTSTRTRQHLVLATAVLAASSGCQSAPPQKANQAVTTSPTTTYPPRPSIPAPPFKLFHQEPSSIVLVTKPDATDEEVEATIWQLRDAAHAGTLARLHLPQKFVDDRKPIAWFHLYRGPKCAAEQYAPGQPPCGASYHAAGDYTFGGYKNRDLDDGLLLHDENHQVELWDRNQPYTPAK